MKIPKQLDKYWFFLKPVLLTTLITGATYSAIYFSVYIVGGNNWFKEKMWHFWFPAAFSLIPIAYIVWKYSKAYTFSYSRFGVFEVFLFSAIFSGLFCGLGVNLISSLSVTQEECHSPEDLMNCDAEYLRLNEISLIPDYYRFTTYESRYRKYAPDDIIVVVYMSAPIASSNDTSFFYFKKYHKNIGVASENKVQSSTAELQKESELDFRHIQQLNMQWTYRNRNTWEQEDLLGLISKNPKFSNQKIILLEDVDSPEEYSKAKLIWLFAPLFLQIIFVTIVFSFKTKYKPSVAKKIKESPFDIGRSEINVYIQTFIESRITFGFIGFCLLIYIAMVLYGANPMRISVEYTYYWSLGRKSIDNGFLWQFVTYGFIHGGLLHLLMNGVMIVIFGGIVESILKWRLMLFFLFIGIIGSGIFSYNMNYDKDITSIGASGFGMSLGGILLGFYAYKELRKEIRIYIGLSLLFIVPTILFGFSFGIDNWAHIGGLITGAIFGIVIGGYLKNRPELIN